MRVVELVSVVLSDPSKRQVYDLFGSDGLESMKSWHVGQRLKTPAEVNL